MQIEGFIMAIDKKLSDSEKYRIIDEQTAEMHKQVKAEFAERNQDEEKWLVEHGFDLKIWKGG